VVGSGAVTQNSGVGTSLAGTYGHLTLNANGSYSYVADQPAADALGAGVTANDVFTYTVTDPDGAVSNTATLTITITGTNDAPVAVADTGAVAEDATLAVAALSGVIRGAGADSDADHSTTSLIVSGVVAGSGSVTQGVGVSSALVGTYGTLTLNSDGSYTYVADQAAADSLANGVTGNDVFTYTVKDPSGAISNTATLTITVTGANETPVLDLDASAAGSGYTTSYNRDTNALIAIADTDSSITDVDSTNINLATISIATNFVSGKDVLSAGSLPSGITASWNATTGVMTLSGSATRAAYETAIEAVRFATSSNSTLDRLITVTVRDNTTNLTSNTATTTVSILGGTGAPALDLDANNSSGATGTGYKATYSGSAVKIADTDVVITDNNSSNMQSATITLTNFKTGDSLSVVGTLPTGITASAYDSATGVLTLSGNATIANYQTAISQIQFATTGTDLSTARTVTVVVYDRSTNNASNTATATINMIGTPTADDVAASGAEDATYIPVTLSAADSDGTIAGYTISTVPSNGTLYTSSSLTTAVTAGSTVTGATLYFVPNANWNGANSFTYTATDNSGKTSNTATASLTVVSVADSPVAANDAGSVNEDATVTATAVTGVIQGPGTDTDAEGGTLTVSGAAAGTGSVAQGSGVGTSLVGTYGTLTLAADGSYSYVADQTAADALPPARQRPTFSPTPSPMRPGWFPTSPG
jgi:VCBS repeat-containing protein